MSVVRPVVFGEVLFDRFPDGRSILGGACFNVAWNLRGLGLDPLFVSRVGGDPLGDEVLDAMGRIGMDTAGVGRDADHPTGVVEVTLDGAEPSYTIVANQAYDHIEISGVEDQLDPSSISGVYHGSLALRAAGSQAGLDSLRRRLPSTPLFVDVNLRAPWWEPDDLHGWADAASAVKLNEDELGLLSPGGAIEPNDDAELEARARGYCETHGLERLIVTLGERGAWLVEDAGTILRAVAAPVTGIQDTVGAGDAFSAVMILSALRGWEPAVALRRASEFASAACSLRGAVTEDRSHYRSFVDRWAAEDGTS